MKKCLFSKWTCCVKITYNSEWKFLNFSWNHILRIWGLRNANLTILECLNFDFRKFQLYRNSKFVLNANSEHIRMSKLVVFETPNLLNLISHKNLKFPGFIFTILGALCRQKNIIQKMIYQFFSLFLSSHEN